MHVCLGALDGCKRFWKSLSTSEPSQEGEEKRPIVPEAKSVIPSDGHIPTGKREKRNGLSTGGDAPPTTDRRCGGCCPFLLEMIPNHSSLPSIRVGEGPGPVWNIHHRPRFLSVDATPAFQMEMISGLWTAP
ncbi:hypothetical protein AVEN_98445-1 [Araneus ventricosus]|uniref:Uncharacterized protein n=1 Tax=Araneus ventricosus TaxID=182803 RepID=A0A4Y2LEH5_ARAVE|nr:hypothetical protein AVEN_98445-1 [Araneus ventricosus]